MAIRANSGSFKKGEVANPKGRPPLGQSISENLRWMQQMSPEEMDKYVPKTVLEQAVKAQLMRMVGDTKAFEVVADRVEGKPVQKIEHSEARPIVFDSSLDEEEKA